MIYFYLWMLHPLSAPLDDVLCIIAKDLVDVIEPGTGLSRIPRLDCRRFVKIETRNIVPRDPAAFGYQSVTNESFFAWSPGHLLNGPVLVEPCARIYLDLLTLVIQDKSTILKQWYFRDSRIDTAGKPNLTRGDENILMLRHV